MIELVFGLSLLVLALLLWWLGLRRSWQWILHSVTERVERHRPRRVPTLEGDRGAAQLRTPFRDELEELTRAGLRQARRLLVLLLGSSVVLVGIAMIILPGPALVVIRTPASPGGAIFAREHADRLVVSMDPDPAAGTLPVDPTEPGPDERHLHASLDLPALWGALRGYVPMLGLSWLSGPAFPSQREYTTLYGLTAARLATAKPQLVVMHPGPMNRGIELDHAVAEGARGLPRPIILEQVAAGVRVRMAVLQDLILRQDPESARTS